MRRCLLSILTLLALGLPALEARAQIAPRRDPCDRRRIEFDVRECETYRARGGTGEGGRNTVGARVEWGTAMPVQGDRLEGVEDPLLLVSESVVEDWGLAILAIRPDRYDECHALGFQGLTAPCIAEVNRRVREEYAAHYREIANTSVEELERRLRAFDPQRTANLPSDRLQSVLLSYRALAQPDGASMLRVLREDGRKLPVRERLLLVQRVGGIMLSAYDLERNNQGILARGEVKLDEMLKFHRAREIERPRQLGQFYGFPPLSGPDFLGVCRDIASAQGEMLQAMGFDETYIVAYFATGVLHTTLLTEDPERRGNHYRINYARLNTAPGAGPDMLYQDDGTIQQDTTLRYYIHRPGGETLATVPSELGLLLTRALRGDAAMERLAPGYVPKGWLAQGEFNFLRHFGLRAFAGATSRGERYQGVGLTVVTGDRQSVYRQEIGIAPFLKEMGPMATASLYAYYEGTLRTSDLKIGDADRVRIHAEGMFYVAALIGDISNLREIRPGSLHKPHYAADVRAALALEGLFGNRADRVQGALRIEGQLTPGVSDIRDVTTARVQLDQVVAEGSIFFQLSQSEEGRSELGQTAAGRAYLYGVATAIFDHWGQRGITRVGLDSKWGAVEGRISGRLQDQSPIFRAAAAREMALRLSVRLGALGLAYAEATRPLPMEDRFDGIGPQIRVGGQLVIPGALTPRR